MATREESVERQRRLAAKTAMLRKTIRWILTSQKMKTMTKTMRKTKTMTMRHYARDEDHYKDNDKGNDKGNDKDAMLRKIIRWLFFNFAKS